MPSPEMTLDQWALEVVADYKKQYPNGYQSKTPAIRNGGNSHRVWPSVIAPDGTVYPPFPNLTEFCQCHGLLANGFTRMMKGKVKDHRGWRLATPSDL